MSLAPPPSFSAHFHAFSQGMSGLFANLTSARHWMMARLVASSFAINTLMLAMPIMTLQVYDRIMTHKYGGTLAMLSIGIVVAVAVETMLRAARSYLFAHASAAYEYRSMKEIMEKVANARLLPALRRGTGEYVQAIAALARMKDFAGERLVTFAVDVPYMVLFMALLTYIGGWLVVVPFTLALLFAGVAWFFGKRLQQAIRARNGSDERRYGAMLEALSGIHTIKAMGLEPRFCRDFEYLQTEAGGINFQIASYNHALATSGAIFAQAIIIGVVAGGAPLVIGGHITVGALVACVLLSGRLIQPLQAVLSLWIGYQEYQQAEQSVDRVRILPQRDTVKPVAPLNRIEGRIECRSLCFAYGADEAYTLSDINLTILPGETVALRGINGSGRSTLLKTIAGMYEATKGTVLIDGMRPQDMSAETLVRHVAYLNHEATLFRGTIMENLTAFAPEFQQQAVEIAGLLGIDDMISRLPLGYDTLVDGGPAETIPPGLRQRIAIARVLLHKPKIILFDKADRSLDRDGYNHIFRLFARLKGKATIIIVSDDYNILRLATRECTLARGTLYEAATQDNVYPLSNRRTMEPA